MDNAVKLIEALAKLFGAVAWPAAIIVIAIYLLRRHRGAVDEILRRIDTLSLPGGVEVTLSEQLEAQEQQVIEAAEEVADAPPEKRELAVEVLVETTERHRELSRLARIVANQDKASDIRQKALDDLRKMGPGLRFRGKEIWTIEDIDTIIVPAKRAFDAEQFDTLMRHMNRRLEENKRG